MEYSLSVILVSSSLPTKLLRYSQIRLPKLSLGKVKQKQYAFGFLEFIMEYTKNNTNYIVRY